MIFLNRFSFNFHESLRMKTSIHGNKLYDGCKKHISNNTYRLLYISISLWNPVLIECVQSQWSGMGGKSLKSRSHNIYAYTLEVYCILSREIRALQLYIHDNQCMLTSLLLWIPVSTIVQFLQDFRQILFLESNKLINYEKSNYFHVTPTVALEVFELCTEIRMNNRVNLLDLRLRS